MNTPYKLENTKKVANAVGLNEEDTELLIKAVVVDIKANMNDISKGSKKIEQSQQAKRDKSLQEIAEKSRIIK